VDAGFLERLLGQSRTWSGPCVVILDAAAAINTPGPDAIIVGGQKQYAPRVPTGRIPADAVILLKEEQALVVVEQQYHKDNTGQTRIKRQISVVDVNWVVGLEYTNTAPLKMLGLSEPPAIRENEYRPGMLVG
jgi:hypothetical protein